jgi:hypothetical protein
MRIQIAAAILMVTAAGCSRIEDETEPQSTAVAHGFAALDLVSPATCQPRLGKLRQCVIAPLVYDAPPIDTAVPLRTAVRRQISGNCSSPYALAVSVAVDSVPPTNLPFLSQSELVLRLPDGAAVDTVRVSDASPWTNVAVFADTCRASLTISANEIDVDTKQQAEAILAAIEVDLADAEREVRNYEALLALQAAYEFTRTVAASFHQELTNETMQELRAAALAAGPAMEIAALGCGDALDQPQRDTLFRLYLSLVALGDPVTWQNPDGTTKTLAQFYGADAASVLAKLQSLANLANPSLEAEFRAGLQMATTQRIHLQQKRSLALVQLAPWLGATP